MTTYSNKDQYFIGSVTIHPANLKLAGDEKWIPEEYRWHKKVFDEQSSQWLPCHTIWDHTIKLLPNTPAMLPERLLSLTQKEHEEMHKFVAEHLRRGTIWESWSPYAANFFFIKKKDGKLQPV